MSTLICVGELKNCLFAELFINLELSNPQKNKYNNMTFVVSQFSADLKAILANDEKEKKLVEAISGDERESIEIDGEFFDVGSLSAANTTKEEGTLVIDNDVLEILSVVSK